jgi:uncharacterized protein (TIGR00725 family)
MAFQVAVSGPRHCTAQDEENARTIGTLLADREAVVLCGGRNLGVMSAVASGVRAAGGTCVGILPNGSREGSSPDISIHIVTNAGEARNTFLVWSADALIVVGGSWGTLSELALGMRKGDIPVIQLGGWELLDEQGAPIPGIHHVEDPREAVDLAFSLGRREFAQPHERETPTVRAE